MSARPSRSEAGLLLAYLRPERARLLVLGCVLLVSTLAPVAGPVLLGYAIDAALRGEPSSDPVAIAMAFLGVTVRSDILQVLGTWKSVDLAWRVGNRLRLDLVRPTGRATGRDRACQNGVITVRAVTVIKNDMNNNTN